jgi:hypothetical protein
METIPSFLIPIKKVFDDYHREVNRINASANGSKVILVFFKEKGSVECFGSKAAIYHIHTADEIGVGYDTIANMTIDPEHPYENKRVVILARPIIRIPTNRNKKVP